MGLIDSTIVVRLEMIIKYSLLLFDVRWCMLMNILLKWKKVEKVGRGWFFEQSMLYMRHLTLNNYLLKLEMAWSRKIFPLKKFLTILNVQERDWVQMQSKSGWIYLDITNLKRKRLENKCSRCIISTSSVTLCVSVFWLVYLPFLPQESKILKFLGFMWNPLSWVMEAAAIMAIALAHGGVSLYLDPFLFSFAG